MLSTRGVPGGGTNRHCDCDEREGGSLTGGSRRAAGVVLVGEIGGGEGLLVLDDPEVARRFGFGRVDVE